MHQYILDGAFYNISKPIPGITLASSDRSSVPQSTVTTPVKGSLSTESITTSKGTLPTSSYHDITLATHSSSTSESTIVSPDDLSPSQENTESTTALPQKNAPSVGPNKGNMISYKVTTRQIFITLCFISHKITVIQLLFTTTLFRDLLPINWFAATNVRRGYVKASHSNV